MEEWKEYRLGDIVSFVIDYRGKTPLKLGGKWSTSGYRALSAKNIKTGEIVNEDSIRYVDDVLYKKWMKDEVQRGDIFITSEAPFGQVYHWDSDEKIVLSQRLFCLRLTENVSSKYVYYYMTTNQFQRELDGRATGTTVVGLRQPELLKCHIKLPSIDKQYRIASILKSLDDKIEVNRRINENLEQQAQALFKSWFVDFEPFRDGEFLESELGMIPKGWRVGTIGDYCKVRSGYAFKSSWWSNSGIPVIKIKNITDDGRLDITDGSYVSNKHADLAKEFQTKVGDLLIAMTGATIGKFCIVHSNNKLCVNQRVGKFFLGDNPLKRLPFVYCNLKRSNVLEEIVRRGQGSAQPNISGKDIETISIVYPNEEVIAQFNVLLYPILEKVICNLQEFRRLATLRDVLLPKLMSGELKVNDIN